MTSRRDLLRMGLLAGPAIMLDRPARAQDRAAVDPASKTLRILMLGGTGFLGPHIVNHAVARGHEVTLFNRGKSNPHLFPDLEKIRGDRRAGTLENLAAAVADGRTWDVVVDTSCYYPRVVNQVMDVLDGAVGQYIVISSISVYADMSEPGVDESSPVGTIEDETIEEITGGSYGPLKALCEQAAEARMPGRATAIRPGLIVGPRDSTDRFTYWPVRVRKGGEIMAPGTVHDPVSYIDARDLGQWIVHCGEQNITGVFNANGPNHPTNIGELLYGCKAVVGGDARFTWVDADFLEAQEIAPWMQMTVWVPPVGEYRGFHACSIEAAVKNGLASRPLAETVTDTLAWWDTLPEERRGQPRAGLPAEREQAVLAAWHARSATSQPEESGSS